MCGDAAAKIQRRENVARGRESGTITNRRVTFFILSS
jgi:hypothetical protein